MLIDEELYLEHYGVKGMKWGIRKDRKASGTSRKVDKEARKDAKELARAKMYYGEGAGTRRKLIRESTNAKRKKNSEYAKALDRHTEREMANLDRHASKAQSQRKRVDRTDSAKKSAGYLARMTTGEMGTKAAFTAVIIGGATYLNTPQGRAKMNTSMNTVRNFVSNQKRTVSNNMPNARPSKDLADSISEFLNKNKL